MKHIIYKITHPNGKYYIGRHSTEDINDGYMGSGKWPRSIIDKSVLSKEIIEEVDSFENLIDLETKYLSEHISDPLCMNMSDASTGFPLGDLNPMKNPDLVSKVAGDNHWTRKKPEKIVVGEYHWMNKNIDAKKDFIRNHPMKKEENKQRMSEKTTKRNYENNPAVKLSKEGKHHWQHGNAPNYQGKLNKKLLEEGRHNFQDPDFHKRMVEEGKNPWVGPEGNRKMLAEGRHPSQIKKTCEHCGKEVSKGMYTRWHGDKCKNV